MAFALLLTTAGGALIAVVGWLGAAGRLPRNGWAGIRLPYTLSSDERWLATHRAGGPVMLFGGVAVAASGLAFLPFALLGEVGSVLLTVVMLAQAAIILVAAILSAVVGIARAKATVG